MEGMDGDNDAYVVIASPPRDTDLHGKMMTTRQILNNKPNRRSERLPHRTYSVARPRP